MSISSKFKLTHVENLSYFEIQFVGPRQLPGFCENLSSSPIWVLLPQVSHDFFQVLVKLIFQSLAPAEKTECVHVIQLYDGVRVENMVDTDILVESWNLQKGRNVRPFGIHKMSAHCMNVLLVIPFIS